MPDPSRAGLLPAGFRRTRVGGVTIAARPEIEGWVASAVRRCGSVYDEARTLPGAQPLAGRGTALAVESPAGAVVVRRYLRGGAVARLLSDRYLRGGVPRPWREIAASEVVRHRGIPTPTALAGVVDTGSVFYRAELVTKRVAPATDLATLLFEHDQPAARRVAACRLAGRLLERLAAAGVAHPDLNAKNILLHDGAAGLEAFVLDLDRVRLREGRLDDGSARRARGRLERSLQKWERLTGRRLRPEEWNAIEEGWASGVGWPPRGPAGAG